MAANMEQDSCMFFIISKPFSRLEKYPLVFIQNDENNNKMLLTGCREKTAFATPMTLESNGTQVWHCDTARKTEKTKKDRGEEREKNEGRRRKVLKLTPRVLC